MDIAQVEEETLEMSTTAGVLFGRLLGTSENLKEALKKYETEMRIVHEGMITKRGYKSVSESKTKLPDFADLSDEVAAFAGHIIDITVKFRAYTDRIYGVNKRITNGGQHFLLEDLAPYTFSQVTRSPEMSPYLSLPAVNPAANQIIPMPQEFRLQKMKFTIGRV